MSGEGMHTSFQGVSMVREFTVAEIEQLLTDSYENEVKHYERSRRQYSDRCKSDADVFLGLIEDRIDKCHAALEVLERLGDEGKKTIKLDMSRVLTQQILDNYQNSQDKKHPLRPKWGARWER